jgi:PAS domain-containing protein
VVERTAELRASEQRFQALVQHRSEVVILVDADARVEYVSESMTRVFGYRDEELLGQPLSDLLDPDAAARLREGLAEVAERPYGVLELELPCGTGPGTGAPPRSPSPTCSTVPRSVGWC